MKKEFKKSSKYYCNYDFYNYFLNEKKKNLLLDIILRPSEHVSVPLLDSSLITETHFYNYKIIECGDYVQVYRFSNIKSENKKDKLFKNIDSDYLFKKDNLSKKNELKVIEYKNIMRSKFQLQRIVKSNEKIFNTFITLTFEENIVDINFANKCLHSWLVKVRSIYKDFKYVCVPEFQKRGAVHYHLLTNLDIEKEYEYIRRNRVRKTKLIKLQEYTGSCYDVNYWRHGFTSVFPVKDINIVGYISKYMTKDIDNRLFGHCRYMKSNNLCMPKEVFIDANNCREFSKLFLVQNLYHKRYTSNYVDYFGNGIEFVEYKLES